MSRRQNHLARVVSFAVVLQFILQPILLVLPVSGAWADSDLAMDFSPDSEVEEQPAAEVPAPVAELPTVQVPPLPDFEAVSNPQAQHDLRVNSSTDAVDDNFVEVSSVKADPTLYELLISFDTGAPDYAPVASDMDRLEWNVLPPPSCNALESQGGYIPDDWTDISRTPWFVLDGNTYTVGYSVEYNEVNPDEGDFSYYYIGAHYQLDQPEEILAAGWIANDGWGGWLPMVLTICDASGNKVYQNRADTPPI
jgi:hypothetical protein